MRPRMMISKTPHRSLLAAICLLLLPTVAARGQFVDDFSDGDYTSNPTWTSADTLWSVVPSGTDNALRTRGLAISDTLSITTPSTIAYGTWSFDVRFVDGQLTNFNQIRVFLMSDLSDLTEAVSGYQLQIGTNNRNVRLYRVDPGASGDRELLASSDNDIVSGTDRLLSFTVQRSNENAWAVSLDGAEVLTHVETGTVFATSSFFGLWVKHSQTRADSYFFDNFDVSDTQPPDTTPPTLVEATYDAGLNDIFVDFSESLDPATVQVTDFMVDGGVGGPESVELADRPAGPTNARARLSFASRLSTGTYNVSVTDLTDVAGNVIVPAAIPVDVVSDTTPPSVTTVEVIDNANLRVIFDENVDPNGGCGSASNYSVSGGVGSPETVACGPGPTMLASLQFAPALEPGAYTLTVTNIADLSGNVMSNQELAFAIDFSGDTPVPGDLVVNEFLYDPIDSNLEFVELLNVSDKTFDLADFQLADNRGAPADIVDGPIVVAPNAYAVVVRDADAFASAFSGVAYSETSSWPALNNGGDAVVLSFSGSAIDSVAYDPSWGGNDVSLERRDPAGPPNSRTNWGSSTSPNGATPGAQNSIFNPDLVAPTLVFAEQAGAASLLLHFDEPLEPASVTTSGVDVDGDAPTDLSLLAGGTTVAVMLDQALARGANVSVSGFSDLTGNTVANATAPVAAIPEAGEIVVNEIMFDPRANDSDGLQDQTEYLELHSTVDQLLTLSGMFWTDQANEDGIADTVRFVGEPVGISGEGFAVVFAQQPVVPLDEVYVNSSLVQAFPADYLDLGVTLIAVNASSLGLLNDGDLVNLHRLDGTKIDSVFYDPAWHNPNLRESKGVSLERYDPNGPSSLARNWSSSVALGGGTPGETNSVFLSPDITGDTEGLSINPSPFSPDDDGFEDVTAIAYSLQSAAALIRVRIFDSRGRIVRSLEESRIAASTGNIIWDGKDDDGRDLRIGIYVVLLEAIDTAAGRTEKHKSVVVLARPLG